MTALHALASNPPLGWNSFDCFNASVTEAEVKANADVFARRLAPLGWEYVVVDFCWSHPTPNLELSPDLELLPDGSVHPSLVLDSVSRQIPAPNRFPSSASGQGFKPLGDYIHSLGLKFGIHIMRGIPRQAVQQNLPIAGGFHARDIAQPESICTWLNHMCGVDMCKPGAQAYYNSLFELYAQWGVDYIKVDDMTYPYHAAEIEAIQHAIQACGRPMILSLSPGPTPLESAAHLREYANLWRISSDFWDDWAQLKKHFELCRDWTPHIEAHHYPDADMLPLGSLSLRGPQAAPRQTNLTRAEQFALMSLFAIVRSPLMIGSDLPSTDEFTFSLLTNPEVLAVNQHSENTRVLFFNDTSAAWVADVPNSTEKYLAVFNLSDTECVVNVSLSDIGLPTACQIRDLWQRTDLPSQFTNTFAPTLPAHGGGLYRVSHT
ncbi:MAG: glycoside hydrolase family 27 protein [Chloroflexota bacterium]|nr:glycoside hydrolase family 27 protein [Chloroflexota bacterium]